MDSGHAILFIGHSHLMRLQPIISRQHSHFHNFKENIETLQCIWKVRGGLRVKHLLPKTGVSDSENDFALKLQQVIDCHQPNSLVVAIGDNDVDNFDSPELLALRIFNVVTVLKNRNPSVKIVTILQLFPRYDGARGDINAYNNKAKMINEQLLQLAKQTDGIRFFYANFKFPEAGKNAYQLGQANFENDGVHLNLKGKAKLCHRLRDVIKRHLRLN